MSASLNRIVAVNTLSNYVLIAIRIVYAVLITRFLYRALGVDYYGFWSILWALFTYVVIFNFGFGATIQKYTAEQLFETEPKKYNAIISLVVAFYIAASVVICIGAAVGIVWIRSWTNIESESILRDCRIALAIFTLGISAIFPLSVFSDILVGLKLIYLKNAVMVCMRLFEIAGVYTCITLDAGFTTIVSFSVGTNILFAIFLVFVVKKKIATFRLVPSFDFGLLREVGQFSFFVYINSLAMLVTAKSDRFILSSVIGLPAVGLYQIGSRLPDMSQQLSSQFQDNVIPVAANLAKNGKSSDLRKILLAGMRICVDRRNCRFFLSCLGNDKGAFWSRGRRHRLCLPPSSRLTNDTLLPAKCSLQIFANCKQAQIHSGKFRNSGNNHCCARDSFLPRIRAIGNMLGDFAAEYSGIRRDYFPRRAAGAALGF